ncbi:MAG: hypothetical protein RIC84_11905 [Aggregatilineales bacterium]
MKHHRYQRHMMHPHRYRRPFFFSPVFFVLMFMFFIGWKVFLFAPLIFFVLFMMKGNMMRGNAWSWSCNDDERGDPRYDEFRGYDDADDYYAEKPKGKPKRGNNDEFFDDEPMIL